MPSTFQNLLFLRDLGCSLLSTPATGQGSHLILTLSFNCPPNPMTLNPSSPAELLPAAHVCTERAAEETPHFLPTVPHKHLN